MIRNKLTLLYFALVMFFLLGTSSTFAAGTVFSRILKIGSSGEDVQQLQKLLNNDPETRISPAGQGSPGQETAYFGALTQNAVIRLQEKYRSVILLPQGLSIGTGVVGIATASFLNSLAQAPAAKRVSGEAMPMSIATTTSSSTLASNPNLKNLDKFLSAVESASMKKGLPQVTIDRLKNQIIVDVATSTDLMATFLGMVKKKTAGVSDSDGNSNGNIFADTIQQIIAGLRHSIFPQTAHAQTDGDTPFGGALYFSYFCSCTGNWLLAIQPLAPSYVTLLTYYEGSEIYQYNNLPFSTELLGKYSSGGQCQIYVGEACSTLPSDGEVTPTVGSSI